MVKKIVRKRVVNAGNHAQNFLQEYRNLKRLGTKFDFKKLAWEYKLTLNQARGVVGGSSPRYSDGLLPKRKPVGRPRKAAEKSKVEKATGAIGQARAEIGLKPVENPDNPLPKGQWVGVSMSKALDQEPIVVEFVQPVEKTESDKKIEFLQSHLNSYKDLAEYRATVIELRNARITALEQKLGQIAFDKGLI